MPATKPPQLDKLLTEMIGDELENPLSDDIEDQAGRIATLVIEKLHLRRGSYFIDDNDEDAPVKRFFAIDGRIDVDDENTATTDDQLAEPSPQPDRLHSRLEGHIFNPYGAIARGLR